MNLESVRKEIDKINEEMFALYLKRDSLATQVAEIKKQTGADISVPAREKEIFDKLIKKFGKEHEAEIKKLFETVMALSRENQRRRISGEKVLAVVAAGAAGAYTELAAKTLFPDRAVTVIPNFRSVAEAVATGAAECGVLPVYNSLAGSVGDVYNIISQYRFRITGTVELKIEHCLLGHKKYYGNKTTTVISHPQALMQCSKFINQKGYASLACESTSEAANNVMQSARHDIAAIASKDCAEIYKLDILEENIQNEKENHTRFISITL